MKAFSFLAMTWLTEKFIGLGIWVARQIYALIGVLYNVFSNVAKVNLFDEATFNKLTGNLYIVIGIAMLFIFAYNIILMIINPDNKKSTGSATKMVQQTITSLVLVILLPSIFNWLYIFQNHVLDSQIITKIILNNVGNSDMPKSASDCKYRSFSTLDTYKYTDYEGSKSSWFFWTKRGNTNYDDAKEILNDVCMDVVNQVNANKMNESVYGAYTIAPIILSAFYYPQNFSFDECYEFVENGASFSSDAEDISVCINYYTDIELSKMAGNIKPFSDDKYLISLVADDSNTAMEFMCIWAWVAGVIALIMFVAYTIEVGVRVAKLGVLQLISPVPMLLRIIPNQNEMYEKWLKNLRETYVDVFLRLVIINFSLFGISRIPSVVGQLFSNGSAVTGNFWVKSLTIAFLILGLLQFAKECPTLLKEFFGDSGKFSIKGGLDKLKGSAKTAGKIGGAAVGMASGAAFGAARNRYKNNIGENEKEQKRYRRTGMMQGGIVGAYRGLKNGWNKGITGSKSSLQDTMDSVDKARGAREKAYNEGDGSIIRGMYRSRRAARNEFGKDITALWKGTNASSAQGTAAEAIMGKVEGYETIFKNAVIGNLIAGRSKINEDFQSEKEFDFNGYRYRKTGENEWTGTKVDARGEYVKDASGKYITESHSIKSLGEKINDYYKDRMAQEYYKATIKSEDMKEAFKSVTEDMMKTLSDNMPKMGSEFAKNLFDKLNKEDGLNLGVETIDQLSGKMEELFSSGKAEDGQQLYKIYDEIKTVAKGVQKRNTIEVEAQKSRESKKSDDK